tara:strand:+ start:248 stop:424 length:177 start_codon:yes stop_codon:yes gene_type:complete
MATRYKKYADDPEFGPTNTIQRIAEDGVKTCIPMIEANRDYKEYLEWVAEGNTAEAAD